MGNERMVRTQIIPGVETNSGPEVDEVKKVIINSPVIEIFRRVLGGIDSQRTSVVKISEDLGRQSVSRIDRWGI